MGQAGASPLAPTKPTFFECEGGRQGDVEAQRHLAIPTLGGATVYALVKNLDTLQARGDLVALALGTLAAFITAAFAIRWMLGYVAHHDFRGFAVYRIVAGVLILMVFRP